MRGELDWIVMKALEKDRNRRYETANGFAADIERYLNDEPVEACPPSAAYRFRKFAGGTKRRWRSAVTALPVLARRQHRLGSARSGRSGGAVAQSEQRGRRKYRGSLS